MKMLCQAGQEEAHNRFRIVLASLRRLGLGVVTCFPPDKAFKHCPGL